MKEEKKRKKDLGIFYTDERIVNFIFDVLLLWKDKEDEKTHRWSSSSDKPKYPSVIDPACGEGGFLKVALIKKFTNPKYIWGIDIDEEVKKKWEDINLLKSFGSKAELDNHFIHQNGLLPLPDRRFRYKKNGLEQFDCVVGNPPYGGIGVKPKNIDPETQNLLNTLQEYEVFSYRKRTNGKKNENKLFKLTQEKTKFPLVEIVKLAQGMPIEVLFIERFIQLTKPGGYIAMIIPDGVLANANLDYVRKFIAANTKIEGIISLPRSAFKNVGTSAKTSILFLKKIKPENLNYHVLMADIPELKGNDLSHLKEQLDFVFNYYKEVYPMNPKPNIVRDKIVYHKSPYSKRLTTIWVTKNERDLFEACATDTLKWSRWDSKYHLPIMEEMEATMRKNYRLRPLYELRKEIIVGDHIRERLNERYTDSERGVLYLKAEAISDTGLLSYKVKRVTRNVYKRLHRSQPKIGDLLIAFGGSIGKMLLVTKDCGSAITCDLCIFRCKGVSPFYLYIYLKTFWGRTYMEILKNGTGIEHLNSDEFQLIQVPIIPELIQSHIESEHKKISVYHDKAMVAKSKGVEVDYRKNIGIAEKMLKDLIAKTEAVIRGERKDVI